MPGNRHAGFGGRLPGKGPICRDLAGQPTLLGDLVVEAAARCRAEPDIM